MVIYKKDFRSEVCRSLKPAKLALKVCKLEKMTEENKTSARGSRKVTKTDKVTCSMNMKIT